jgi:hypothetical protein
VIPLLSVAYLKATIRTEGGSSPGEGDLCIANVASGLHPLITGVPYLVQPDSQGQVTVAVKNCSLLDLELQRNDFIGSVENVQDCEAREVNPAYLQAIADQREAARPRSVLSAKKKNSLLTMQNCKCLKSSKNNI